MIEEVGTIIAVENELGKQKIWVETEIKTTCNACQVQANCGTSVVAKAFSTKKQSLKLSYEAAVEIGQKVKLGIPEEALLNASVQVYLLPILGLIAGALLANLLLPLLSLESELWVVLSGFMAAIGVFLVIKHRLARLNQQQFCAILLDVIPTDSQVISVKNL
jgi:sigma-E factor negative regulatory protein RseC